MNEISQEKKSILKVSEREQYLQHTRYNRTQKYEEAFKCYINAHVPNYHTPNVCNLEIFVVVVFRLFFHRKQIEFKNVSFF